MGRRPFFRAGLALAAVAILAIVAQPRFAWRYGFALFGGIEAGPSALYSPQERVAGGDGAPLPRQTADEANIEVAALDAAAEYAELHGSRALLVSRRGHLVYERYWHGTSFETVANADAFSGVLTALAIGVAIGERRIESVDDPAAKWITEWRGDARAKIRLRDLLQMSSGLAPLGSAALPWSGAAREQFGSDIVGSQLRRPAVARPGDQWVPQSIDTQMLALVVERATQRRYADYLSERLWKPLDAGDAFLWLDREGGAPHANCCFFARQGDWLRVAALLLEDGVFEGERILPPGWAAELRMPAKGNANYGYQLWLGAPFAPERAYGHARRGDVSRSLEPYAAKDVFFLDGAGHSRLWLVPSLQLAILRTGDARDSTGDWDDSKLPNLVIRGVRDRPPQLPAGPDVDISTLVPNH